jgi:transposase
LLTTWAADRDAVDEQRDEVVRVAVDAGISKSEAHRITGISRSTIDRIVASAPDGPETAHGGNATMSTGQKSRSNRRSERLGPQISTIQPASGHWPDD